MEAAFWDKRYGEPDYVYGNDPNAHVKRCAELYLHTPCHVVELACGEGRNVAFLAMEGHTVTAVDFSRAGLDKTLALTRQLGGPGAAARVRPVCADILTWRSGQAQRQEEAGEAQREAGQGAAAQGEVQSEAGTAAEAQADCVVLSFCHVTADSRPGFMAGVRDMLRPGGLLIQEVFHPNQIHKGYRPVSGGPHDAGMMVTLEELRSQLGDNGGRELDGEELEYVLKEGRLHDGLGAVTRYVWRKAAA